MIEQNSKDMLDSKRPVQQNNTLMKEAMLFINSLKDAQVEKYFNLPTVAVVGIQSSGKSSVLEGLIGLDILPRSDGLCTRTPIELRMYNTSSEEYAIVMVVKNSNDMTETPLKVTDLNELKKIIIEQTDYKAGYQKNIVDKPIIISIYSTKCPDLTVVDLPGIVNNPLEGSDQPKDIDEITWNISKKYCEKEETIMLCVLASGVDITTSQILRYAKKVDPEGKRTMGVLTKLDLMNEGTSSEEALLGKQVKLELGFIAVKNRTQIELGKITLKESFEKEKRFFASHKVYSKIPEYCGTGTLLNKVSKALYNQINKSRPKIMETINKLNDQLSKDLINLGEVVPENRGERRSIILMLFENFTFEFKNAMEGRNLHQKKIAMGGFLIVETFSEFLADKCYPGFKVSDSLTDKEITDKLRIYYGDTFENQASVHAYFNLLNPLIKALEYPIIQYLSELEDIILSICFYYIEIHFKQYFKLELRVKEYARGFILRKLTDCKNYILKTINIIKRPFTNNREFHEEIEEFVRNKLSSESTFKIEMQSQPKKINLLESNSQPSNNHKSLCIVQSYDVKIREIRLRIDSYFNLAIISKLRDMIPGAIKSLLIHELSNQISRSFIEQSENDPELIQLLDEDDDTKSVRLGIVSQKAKLQKLKVILLSK